MWIRDVVPSENSPLVGGGNWDILVVIENSQKDVPEGDPNERTRTAIAGHDCAGFTSLFYARIEIKIENWQV